MTTDVQWKKKRNITQSWYKWPDSTKLTDKTIQKFKKSDWNVNPFEIAADTEQTLLIKPPNLKQMSMQLNQLKVYSKPYGDQQGKLKTIFCRFSYQKWENKLQLLQSNRTDSFLSWRKKRKVTFNVTSLVKTSAPRSGTKVSVTEKKKKRWSIHQCETR